MMRRALLPITAPVALLAYLLYELPRAALAAHAARRRLRQTPRYLELRGRA